ncbi:MAG TPA: NAD(P)-binding domain-containing protein, partial [Chloroflexota bacterium]|nr:NAD(P)-binding domain-containing protein [Chloroflexota bacterium]
MKSIGILNVGDLTENVVQGLRRSDYCAPIYLCSYNQPRVESLAQSFLCKIMPDDQSVVDSADILLIGDRPDNLRALA